MTQPTTGRLAPDSVHPQGDDDLRGVEVTSLTLSDVASMFVQQKLMSFASEQNRETGYQELVSLHALPDDIRVVVAKTFRSKRGIYRFEVAGVTYSVEVHDRARRGFLLTLLSREMKPMSDL